MKLRLKLLERPWISPPSTRFAGSCSAPSGTTSVKDITADEDGQFYFRLFVEDVSAPAGLR